MKQDIETKIVQNGGTVVQNTGTLWLINVS
jgi:hypothetical protein